jgi:NADH-quinone oxidoreductase subunit J
MLDSVLFYFFAGTAIASAGLMITRRNAVYSAICLVSTLLATAGIFLQLRAEFLFIVQIMLFAGGITVLFVFVIIVLRLDVTVAQIRAGWRKWVGLVVALFVGVEAGAVILLARQLPGQGLIVPNAASAETLPPNTQALAKSLFSDYLLPLEMVSVLSLAAIVGAVVMAKKRAETP